MTVHLITRDAKRIGIAPHDNAGLGALTWFHINVHAYSMDHATTHEGYGVETVEEVDCHDVESLINAICERKGVTMESTFVPFSQSRNAKPDSAMGGKPWRSLNWRVTIKRAGREILTTDYAQGEGHAPASKKTAAQMETAARVMGRPVSVARAAMVDHEIETGHVARGFSSLGLSKGADVPAPSIGDVLQSLARDSDVLDAGGFEEWAGEFGYDTDSRSAEATYRACLEIATKLRAGLGESLLSEIRLAASFN